MDHCSTENLSAPPLSLTSPFIAPDGIRFEKWVRCSPFPPSPPPPEERKCGGIHASRSYGPVFLHETGVAFSPLSSIVVEIKGRKNSDAAFPPLFPYLLNSGDRCPHCCFPPPPPPPVRKRKTIQSHHPFSLQLTQREIVADPHFSLRTKDYARRFLPPLPPPYSKSAGPPSIGNVVCCAFQQGLPFFLFAPAQ